MIRPLAREYTPTAATSPDIRRPDLAGLMRRLMH